MTRRATALPLLLAATLAFAGGAIAKEGVSNPTVKARMDHMGKIKAKAGVIADMATGKAAFDTAGAEGAAAALSALAIGIPQKFEPAESDPVSEARPAIWTNFKDFSARADALYQAAQGVDATSADTLAASSRAIGAACKSCHDSYRD